MRFIRKGGRIIPINDRKPANTPGQKLFKRGLRTQSAGVLAIASGMSAMKAAPQFKLASHQMGENAMGLARTAFALKNKHAQGYATYKAAARTFASQSLKAGKIAGRLRTGGAIAALAGVAAIPVGIAMTGFGTRKMRKESKG